MFGLWFSVCYSQLPYEMIPQPASIVLSVNNVAILEKISLDELIKYDFMIDMQQELFDGSAKQKNIKDIGIDFDQRLNVFYGRTTDYELSGFTFGIDNTEKLLSVFHNFTKQPFINSKAQHYTSLFNHLIIYEKCALLFRLEALSTAVNPIVDSIWIARGNYPSTYFYEIDEESDNKLIEIPIDNIEEKILTVEKEESRNKEHILTDNEQTYFNNEYEESEPIDILSGKTFWELLDSITIAQQETQFNELMKQLLIEQLSLVKADSRFEQHINNTSDAIFYLDNSRTIKRNVNFWYAQTILPSLYDELNNLYTDNVILGDIYLNEQTIQFEFTANYGTELGTIYKSLTDAKFDNNILKYIHKDCKNFFSYTINIEKAYQKTYEVIIPLLEKEHNINISMRLLALELLDELVDKKAIFGLYKGSMFGTFNKMKTVKTKEFIYRYDEQTWEYFEEEVEKTRQIPIFTLGFSTTRPDIVEKILTRLSRMTSQIQKENDYWIFHEAFAETIPLYFLLKNGLFILTNDESLVKQHIKGYGKFALSGKKAKQLQKNGFMYAQANSQQFFELLMSTEQFSKKLQQKTEKNIYDNGKIVLTSSKTDKEKTEFHATYSFESSYDNSIRYILDFVNNLYMLSK